MEKFQMSLEASGSPQILKMPFKQWLIDIELSAGQKDHWYAINNGPNVSESEPINPHLLIKEGILWTHIYYI
jgi:hypothetical protein